MTPSQYDHISIAAAKTALRVKAQDQRSTITSAERGAATLAFLRHGLEFIKSLPGDKVSGYHPIDEEADCLVLLCALEAASYTIALPVVIARDEPLVFRVWNSGDPLEMGGYGIQIPKTSAPVVVPDIVLVPLLAFDAQGFRLGYGGGYYDRVLRAMRHRSTVIAIGIAFGAQEVDAVPHEKTDEPLDWILTEKGPFQCVREK